MALSACGSPEAEPVILVASGFTDEILILDPSNGETVDVRDMDVRPAERDEPHAVATSPDGLHWYATLSHGEPTLWKYETEGDRLVGRVSLETRGAGRIGISPDSRYAVIPDYWLGGGGQVSDVAVVRLDDLVVERRIPLCSAPHDAVFSPDGSTLAITCPLSDEVVALDGQTFEEVWRNKIPDSLGEVGEAGNPLVQPMNLVWAPDGQTVYVTLMRSGELATLNENGEGRARAAVGGGPAQLGITPDGTQLVIAARQDWAAVIMDAETLQIRARVATPEQPHPHGVAISPDGSLAILSHEGTISSAGGVTAIEISTASLLWSKSVGSFNLGVVWRAPPRDSPLP